MPQTVELPDPVDTHVGLRMRALRLAAGLSQTELGLRLGVTFQQVQKYEKGANRVSASVLSRAAKALNCQVQEFFPASGAPEAEVSSLAMGRRSAQLMGLYERLDSGKRQLVLDLARALAGSGDGRGEPADGAGGADRGRDDAHRHGDARVAVNEDEYATQHD